MVTPKRNPLRKVTLARCSLSGGSRACCEYIHRGRFKRPGARRERLSTLALLQRFDDDATPALTPEELKARWVGFHNEIRRMAGARWQRIAGRMLGEDTRRYRLARLLFRPALRAWRNARKIEKKKAPLVSVGNAPEVYPINYRPRVLDYEAALATLTFDASDVTSSPSTRKRRHPVCSSRRSMTR